MQCNLVSGVRRCNRTNYRSACRSSLGYDRHLAFNKRKWKQFKTLYFFPPSQWLLRMIKSQEFRSLLDKTATHNEELLMDVMDGMIWKKFENEGFFSSKYHFGLMLFVDWFRPFKRSQYKVACLLITVLNLPREEQFKKKWTILAGKYLLDS